jgi:hypothetical protein
MEALTTYVILGASVRLSLEDKHSHEVHGRQPVSNLC